MIKGFQDKMYNYEVAPPVNVWDNIALELDEVAIDKNNKVRLQKMEVMPVASIWQKISSALDESLLVTDYAAKLSGLAIPPPVSVWDKINTSLEAASSSIVPMRRRISPFIRYAVAATIIGLITWGAFYLFNSNSDNSPIVKENISNPTEDKKSIITDLTKIIPAENIGIDDVTASLEEARNDAALEASKKTYAKLDATHVKSKVKNAANFYFSSAGEEPEVGSWQPIINKKNLSNRYFTLMTPEGNIIRISKKLSDIVGCVAGAEQDQECLDQLKIWRQTMANPKSTHSSGNLMEMLNLLTALQDN